MTKVVSLAVGGVSYIKMLDAKQADHALPTQAAAQA